MSERGRAHRHAGFPLFISASAERMRELISDISGGGRGAAEAGEEGKKGGTSSSSSSGETRIPERDNPSDLSSVVLKFPSFFLAVVSDTGIYRFSFVFWPPQHTAVSCARVGKIPCLRSLGSNAQCPYGGQP